MWVDNELMREIISFILYDEFFYFLFKNKFKNFGYRLKNDWFHIILYYVTYVIITLSQFIIQYNSEINLEDIIKFMRYI